MISLRYLELAGCILIRQALEFIEQYRELAIQDSNKDCKEDDDGMNDGIAKPWSKGWLGRHRSTFLLSCWRWSWSRSKLYDRFGSSILGIDTFDHLGFTGSGSLV